MAALHHPRLVAAQTLVTAAADGCAEPPAGGPCDYAVHAWFLLAFELQELMSFLVSLHPGDLKIAGCLKELWQQ